MNVYDIVANNILYYMEQLENDKDFKKDYPDIKVFDYICENADIKPRRLKKILEIGAVRRPTIYEVYKIAFVLRVPIYEIITKESKRWFIINLW